MDPSQPNRSDTYYSYFKSSVTYYYSYAQNLGSHPAVSPEAERPKNILSWTLFQMKRALKALGRLFYYNIGLGIAKVYYYSLSGGAYALAILSIPFDAIIAGLKKKNSSDAPERRASTPDKTGTYLKRQSAPDKSNSDRVIVDPSPSHKATIRSSSTPSKKPTPSAASSSEARPTDRSAAINTSSSNTSSDRMIVDPSPSHKATITSLDIIDRESRPIASPSKDANKALKNAVLSVIQNAQFSSRLKNDYVINSEDEIVSYRLSIHNKPTTLEQWQNLFRDKSILRYCVQRTMERMGHYNFDDSSESGIKQVQKAIQELDQENALKYDYPDYCPEQEKEAYDNALKSAVLSVIQNAQFSSRLKNDYVINSEDEILSYRVSIENKPNTLEQWQNLFRHDSIWRYCVGQHMTRMGYSNFDYDSELEIEGIQTAITQLHTKEQLKYDYPDYFPEGEKTAYEVCFKEALEKIIINMSFNKFIWTSTIVYDDDHRDVINFTICSPFEQPTTEDKWFALFQNQGGYYDINRCLSKWMEKKDFRLDHTGWTREDKQMIRDVISDLARKNELPLADRSKRHGPHR